MEPIKEKKKSYGCLILIGIVAFLLIGMNVCNNDLPMSPQEEAHQKELQLVRNSVTKYLRENLKDPKSYEEIEWSEIAHRDGKLIVRHKYRAKNSFGGFVIDNKVFFLTSLGTVENVIDYTE